jgi:hypothetical protein
MPKVETLRGMAQRMQRVALDALMRQADNKRSDMMASMTVQQFIEFVGAAADMSKPGMGMCFAAEGKRVTLTRRCRSQRNRNVVVTEKYAADVAWVKRTDDGLYFTYSNVCDKKGKRVASWGASTLTDVAPEFGIVSVVPVSE